MFQLNSSIVAPVPYIYENTTREVEKYVQLVQIVGLILAMGALFMLLFLGGLLGPYVKEMITATDIFSDKHLHPLGPIWTRNMFVGVLCMILDFLFHHLSRTSQARRPWLIQR